MNGGNGPGHSYFHNPGSIWRDKRGLGVTSIYSAKLVYLNENDLSIKESIYLNENNFSFDKTGILKQLYPTAHISDWSLSPLGYGYENPHKKIQFGNQTFHLGYSRLIPENSNFVLRMPLSYPNTPIFGNTLQHYFLNIAEFGNAKILFSYNSPYMIVIFFKNNFIQAFPIITDQLLPIWQLENNNLINARGVLTVQGIPLNIKLLELEKIADTSSTMSIEEKLTLITNFCCDATRFNNNICLLNNTVERLSYIKPFFASSFGKGFFHTLSNNINNKEIIVKAADKYFQDLLSFSGEIDLAELLLISFFSGIFPWDNIKLKDNLIFIL